MSKDRVTTLSEAIKARDVAADDSSQHSQSIDHLVKENVGSLDYNAFCDNMRFKEEMAVNESELCEIYIYKHKRRRMLNQNRLKMVTDMHLLKILTKYIGFLTNNWL
jgi:hypothetical protein